MGLKKLDISRVNLPENRKHHPQPKTCLPKYVFTWDTGAKFSHTIMLLDE